jgi:hypothetical protein
MPETDGSMQLMMLMHKFQQSLLGASGHDEEIIALEDDLRVAVPLAAVPLAARANACSSRSRRAAAPRHAGGIIPRGAVFAAAALLLSESVGAVCQSRPVAAYTLAGVLGGCAAARPVGAAAPLAAGYSRGSLGSCGCSACRCGRNPLRRGSARARRRPPHGAGPGPGPGLFARPARPLQIASASDLLLGTEFECNRIVAMDPSSAAARIG